MKALMVSLDAIERKVRSQNGEDGIIDYLLKSLPVVKKSFAEIGCGSGNENNTSALAEKGWTGTVYDSKAARIESYRARGYGVDAYYLQVKPELVDAITDQIDMTPDIFSLDIDSHDYHVMKALLNKGFRPAIAVLEYNSLYGHRSITTPYPRPKRQNKQEYFGCGLKAWTKLMADYEFVTVDSSGTNAFFIRGHKPESLNGVQWVKWVEKNEHFKRVSHLPMETV